MADLLLKRRAILTEGIKSRKALVPESHVDFLVASALATD
jgi:hypothetical protein